MTIKFKHLVYPQVDLLHESTIILLFVFGLALPEVLYFFVFFSVRKAPRGLRSGLETAALDGILVPDA